MVIGLMTGVMERLEELLVSYAQTAVGFYLVINAITAAAFAVDKGAARAGRRRIAERTLITLILLGGAVGAAVARRVVRHKTRKRRFTVAILIAAAVHVGGWLIWLRIGGV